MLAHAALTTIAYAKGKTDAVESLIVAQHIGPASPRADMVSPALFPLRDLPRARLRLVEKGTNARKSVRRLGRQRVPEESRTPSSYVEDEPMRRTVRPGFLASI